MSTALFSVLGLISMVWVFILGHRFGYKRCAADTLRKLDEAYSKTRRANK